MGNVDSFQSPFESVEKSLKKTSSGTCRLILVSCLKGTPLVHARLIILWRFLGLFATDNSGFGSSTTENPSRRNPKPSSGQLCCTSESLHPACFPLYYLL